MAQENVNAILDAILNDRPFSWLPRNSLHNWIKLFGVVVF
jgi:hypothetical protein